MPLCSVPWRMDCPYMKLKNWKRPICTYPNVKTKKELIELPSRKVVEKDVAICPFLGGYKFSQV